MSPAPAVCQKLGVRVTWLHTADSVPIERCLTLSLVAFESVLDSALHNSTFPGLWHSPDDELRICRQITHSGIALCPIAPFTQPPDTYRLETRNVSPEYLYFFGKFESPQISAIPSQREGDWMWTFNTLNHFIPVCKFGVRHAEYFKTPQMLLILAIYCNSPSFTTSLQWHREHYTFPRTSIF
jgi:hypothetical protein